MIAKGEQIITDDGMITEIIREDTIKHPVTKKFVDNTLTFIQRISDGSVYQVRLRRSGDMISVSTAGEFEMACMGDQSGKAGRH